MANKDRTEEALRKRAEAAFSSDVQRCQALCGDLRRTDAEIERLKAAPGDHTERLLELNARFVAISHERQNLGCVECDLP